MVKNNSVNIWVLVIAVAIVVAVVSSVATMSLTGNSIKVGTLITDEAKYCSDGCKARYSNNSTLYTQCYNNCMNNMVKDVYTKSEVDKMVSTQTLSLNNPSYMDVNDPRGTIYFKDGNSTYAYINGGRILGSNKPGLSFSVGKQGQFMDLSEDGRLRTTYIETFGTNYFHNVGDYSDNNTNKQNRYLCINITTGEIFASVDYCR